MTIRERMERMEHEMLSPYAALSENSKGRDYPEAPCDIRPVYQRDRDRILHCKAFRRLKNKTQVFLTPKGDHYRTRMSHTLEVSQNARTIAKALRLNEDLVEAIVQLPTDLFYNTGISTYIWVLTKGKPMSRSGRVQLIDASKCFVKRRKNIGSKRVDLDDACIDLILKAYEGFDQNEVYTADNLVVESKVFENDFFGFTKVTVETAQTDTNGKPLLKKGKKLPVKGATDSEIIPLSDDIDAYMEKNVLPYNPLAYIDPAKDKIGYEIPFTRLFYKFEAPEPSASIFEDIKALEAKETVLMKELFGNA